MSTSRRTARLVLLGLCSLAIVALMGTVFWQSARNNSDATELVELEGDGAASLHPMLSLLGALVDAQSAAVRGASVTEAEAAVDKALTQVKGGDPTYASKLSSGEAVDNLERQIQTVFGRKLTGRPAYDAYSGLVTLADKLIQHIADTSHLIHDPVIDSYFVMNAAIVRLPDAIINAGRAADLVAIGGGQPITGADGVSAAVARFNVSDAAGDVSAGLNQSIDFTSNAALGGNIVDRLDAFMAAAAAFAPPTMITQLSGDVTDPVAFTADARKVYATALSLAHFLLSQLQNLLADRQAGLGRDWRLTATLGGSAALLAMFMLWLVAVGRPRGTHAKAGVASEPGADRDDMPVSPLTDAQRLLDQEELVHVGRAVRPKSRSRGDAF